MSDITIAGATYNDVPSILVPKVGGGFAEYTEGGGGGSLTPFVLRPDVAPDVGRVERDPEKLRRLHAAGYTAAEQSLDALGRFIGGAGEAPI